MNEPLSDDLLCGADAISTYLFGTPKARRKVYHLAENGRLPVFKLGAVLAARKSKILQFIELQEQGTPTLH